MMIENKSEKTDHKTVFVIGGVGQSFIRPYSMIGHMAHKITFNTTTGDI